MSSVSLAGALVAGPQRGFYCGGNRYLQGAVEPSLTHLNIMSLRLRSMGLEHGKIVGKPSRRLKAIPLLAHSTHNSAGGGGGLVDGRLENETRSQAIEQVEDDLEDDIEAEAFISATVSGWITGLPMYVFVFPHEDDPSFASREPCIKVAQRYGNKWAFGEWFAMTIEDEPPKIRGNCGEIDMADVELVEKFIGLNRDILMHHWKDEEPYDDVLQMLRALKRV